MKTARKTPSSHVSRKKSKKFKKFFPVWASGVFEPIKSPENSTPDKKKLTVFTFIFFIFSFWFCVNTHRWQFSKISGFFFESESFFPSFIAKGFYWLKIEIFLSHDLPRKNFWWSKWKERDALSHPAVGKYAPTRRPQIIGMRNFDPRNHFCKPERLSFTLV